ncbi:hypothetical protein [Microbulbifer yueqingensis]|uniref:Uncharacterized protein n=1 Tax=Microbulbifer yueqingensis TaxID=658219 RepID=A0A1G9F3Y0_9GAMM|nr:hypothetical protein [Microbulbifer yueqingensis]SDK82985.1 hypothetical protein SAMN05216212_0034 [Microbulbifer yueqingensis]
MIRIISIFLAASLISSCASSGLQDLDRTSLKQMSIRVISATYRPEIIVQDVSPAYYPLFAYFNHSPADEVFYDKDMKDSLGSSYLHLNHHTFTFQSCTDDPTTLAKALTVNKLNELAVPIPVDPITGTALSLTSCLASSLRNKLDQSSFDWLPDYISTRARISNVKASLSDLETTSIINSSFKRGLIPAGMFREATFFTEDSRIGKPVKGAVKKVEEDFLLITNTEFALTNDTAALEISTEYSLYETLTGTIVHKGIAVYFSQPVGNRLVPITPSGREHMAEQISQKYDISSATSRTEEIQLASKVRESMRRLDKKLELVGSELDMNQYWTADNGYAARSAIQEGINEVSAMIKADLNGTICGNQAQAQRIEAVKPDSFRCLLSQEQHRKRERFQVGRESTLISYQKNWYPVSANSLNFRHIADM